MCPMQESLHGALLLVRESLPTSISTQMSTKKNWTWNMITSALLSVINARDRGNNRSSTTITEPNDAPDMASPILVAASIEAMIVIRTRSGLSAQRMVIRTR